jgi:hypothetical protein
MSSSTSANRKRTLRWPLQSPNGSDIRRYPIVDDDMVLIVHKNHRFANRDCIDLKRPRMKTSSFSVSKQPCTMSATSSA